MKSINGTGWGQNKHTQKKKAPWARVQSTFFSLNFTECLEFARGFASSARPLLEAVLAYRFVTFSALGACEERTDSSHLVSCKLKLLDADVALPQPSAAAGCFSCVVLHGDVGTIYAPKDPSRFLG